MNSKISRLPPEIRAQLNSRLACAEPGSTLLPWLNSLPEVQAILSAFFGGQPINDQNLSDYRKHGFRRWEMRQSALEFSSEAAADAPANPLPPVPLVDNLVQWIAVRFAAAAHASTPADDPDVELRQIRAFLADIVALRRGDLVARRISLEQQRLALEETKNHQELEKIFWEWTKRPDIQAQLYPHRDPDKVRRDVVQMIDRELLGIRSSNGHDPDPDPAALI